MKRVLIFLILALAAAMAAGQKNTTNQDMSGMPMPGHDMSSMSDHDMPKMESAAGAHAMHSMEGHHMEMGPHMKMTALRSPQPGDEEKAQRVVEAARKVAEKYMDYHTALNDGYRIFVPDVPQKQYHFTNYRYAFEAVFSFNPEHPTSLLYKKSADGYQLMGVMYTAPKRFNEDDLNQRIPLSIAQWHEHVNLCLPPSDRKNEMRGPNAKFGLAGAISTQAECEANGGKFHPIIFNWMMHVYPFEKDAAEIWSVERQAHGNGGD
ncbi:MAG: hypothetical protein LAO56_13500 [Acidobacteriia bacterium]|nr:hypothetical protein [Terriglobia bacterium]